MPAGLAGSPTDEDAIRPARARITTPALPARPAGAHAFGSLVAAAPAMGEVFAVMRRLAPTDITLTVIGETGTGKDVIAHAIHEASSRAGGPFVVFDCGAVPANLVETELFGHGGTLFLDEIGELPLDLQPRLLRALESRSIRRVGGSRDYRVDLRIVAATNRDLAALVANRTFRQDLYFRLAAAVVQLPPLRERREDVSLLVPRLLADLGRPEVAVSDATVELLRAHPWPGNVRELKNVLACALAFVDSDLLEPVHLRFVASTGDHSLLDRLPLGGHTLASLEQSAIKQTLALTRGNKVHAARMLGIAASTLYEKLKKYSL